MKSLISRHFIIFSILSILVTQSYGQVVATAIANVAPIRTELITREGFFPLWWSQASYVGGFIALGYTFFGLLALYVYRNWVYDDAVGYRSLKDDFFKLNGYNLDLEDKIREFGSKLLTSK